MKKLENYSFGTGDRFGLQGEAQLRAILRANREGVPLVPVWNKSNREHTIVGTSPSSTWKEASEATAKLGYKGSWYVDADHINLGNVESFLDHSNFFTIDVAEQIGIPCTEEEMAFITGKFRSFQGEIDIPGIERKYSISPVAIEEIMQKFYSAIREAALIYQHIRDHRGTDDFITEISMDEVTEPQSPIELFFILLLIRHFDIPVQTIAPKFTGRFNKGVDYEGNALAFRREFEEDLLVIRHATAAFELPANLKLSIHSGSDKFSIYPVMGELIRKYDCGIHVKTAGTTWLEEVIGLALSGGEGRNLAATIYSKAYKRRKELCAPYANVIDIDFNALPSPDEVNQWDADRFVNSLRHVPEHPEYNPGFRQLIHVGYKIAAEMGDRYLDTVRKNSDIVGREVEQNIYERHIRRLFF
jgi:hypothetical protein